MDIVRPSVLSPSDNEQMSKEWFELKEDILKKLSAFETSWDTFIMIEKTEANKEIFIQAIRVPMNRKQVYNQSTT